MGKGKYNYYGTAKIVQEVCGDIGMLLVKKSESVPEYFDAEKFNNDMATLRCIEMQQKKLIEGSAVEQLFYRFFPGKAREGIDRNIDKARQLHAELEMMACDYSQCEKEMADSYFEKRVQVVNAAKNVENCIEIIVKLESDKQYVFPKPKAIDAEDTAYSEKMMEIDLEKRTYAIQRDIERHEESRDINAISVRCIKSQIEWLNGQSALAGKIMRGVNKVLQCGGMYIDHAEQMKNYFIDGRGIIEKNVEFQNAIMEMNKSLDELLDGMDRKIPIFGSYTSENFFKALFSRKRKKKQCLREDAESSQELIDEALRELEPKKEQQDNK